MTFVPVTFVPCGLSDNDLCLCHQHMLPLEAGPSSYQLYETTDSG